MDFEKRKEELQTEINNYRQEITQLQQRIHTLSVVIERKIGAISMIEEMENEDIDE